MKASKEGRRETPVIEAKLPADGQSGNGPHGDVWAPSALRLSRWLLVLPRTPPGQGASRERPRSRRTGWRARSSDARCLARGLTEAVDLVRGRAKALTTLPQVITGWRSSPMTTP